MHDQNKIIVYGHPGCLMVGPVLAMLNNSGVDYEYINIHQDEQARAHVRQINNGNESVPTLIFPDGSTLTEPSASKLKARLQGDGHQVPLLAFIYGNALQIVFAILVILLILNMLGVI